MQIDIPKQISELLYQHDSVIVPGLGGFISQYKPVVIDHVQWVLHPPSKEISFNGNLVVNDGMLINALQKNYGITYQEAEQIIADYVADIKKAFEKREIVAFPAVGRLYLDFENNYKFIPDNTNYNTDAYGLPTVQFYPMLRNKVQDAPAAPQAAPAVETTTTIARPQPSNNNPLRFLQSFDWSKLAVPAAIGLLILAVSGSFFFMNRSNSQTASLTGDFNGNGILIKDDNRVNKSPKTQDQLDEGTISYDDAENLNDTDVEDAPIDDTDNVDTDEALDISEEVNTTQETTTPAITDTEDLDVEMPIDTESATPIPNQKVAIIIVGSFGTEKYAQRAVEKLYNLGYEPHTEDINGLTRVGAQIPYEDQATVDKALKRLKRKLTRKAWILD